MIGSLSFVVSLISSLICWAVWSCDRQSDILGFSPQSGFVVAVRYVGVCVVVQPWTDMLGFVVICDRLWENPPSGEN